MSRAVSTVPVPRQLRVRGLAHYLRSGTAMDRRICLLVAAGSVAFGCGARSDVAAVERYAQQGWAIAIRGTGFQEVTHLALASNGDLLLCGHFVQEAVVEEEHLQATRDGALFVSRLRPDGSLVWLRVFDDLYSAGGFGVSREDAIWLLGEGAADGTHIRRLLRFETDGTVVANLLVDGFYGYVQLAVGPSGDLAMVGGAANDFYGSAVGWGVKVGDRAIAWPGRPGGWSSYPRPMGVLKLDPDGSPAWTTEVFDRSEKRNPADNHDVVVDAAGGVLLVGTAFGTKSPTGGMSDAQVDVLRLDSHGVERWHRRFGGPEPDYGAAAAVDPAGRVFIAGQIRGPVSFDNITVSSASGDTPAGFLAQLDSDGNVVWVVTPRGGTQTTDVAVSADGRIVVTGHFVGEALFGDTTLTATSEEDVFVAGVRPNGLFDWADSAGAVADDWGTVALAAPDGAVYVAGVFHEDIVFGGTRLARAIDGDAFLGKLLPQW